jgi:two-component system sensor histidine kinase PilS (NtrC family)
MQDENGTSRPTMWLVTLRLLLAGFVLLVLLVWQYYRPESGIPFTAAYGILGSAFLLSILAALLARTSIPDGALSYGQLVGDILLVTWLVYVTGGAGSPFPPAYNLVILAAGTVLGRRGGYVIASLAGLLYGGLSDLQYYRVIPPYDPHNVGDESTVWLRVFLNFLAFFLLAYLGGGLSQRLQQARQELKDSRRNLLDQQAYTRDVLKSMTSGLATTDQAGRLKSYNRAAEDIIGRSLRQDLGRFIWEVISDPGIEGYFLRRRARPSAMDRFEVALKNAKKRKQILGITISPLDDGQENTIGTIAIFQDVTRIKAMEEEVRQKEHLALIGELSAAMAHEIRNPLASLSGCVQVLRETDGLGEEAKRLMDIVVRESDRLNETVSSFLSYARPKPLELERVDLGLLIEETATLLDHSGSLPPGVDVKLDLEGGLVLPAADGKQLRQVFWNLMLNGVQAMASGGRLTIRGRRSESPEYLQSADHGVAVEVVDTGCGIPPETLGKIFYPFFTTKDTGSGLGLAVVYRVIEIHRGRISVQSREGLGTTVRLFLPALVREDALSRDNREYSDLRG